MNDAIRPYALGPGEGWVYHFPEVDFVVKAGELGRGRRLAVVEYRTSEDEWPGHTHNTEDEIFIVMKGSLTFGCGDETFDVDDGGFVFLPRGIKHGYKIRDGKEAHLMVVTSPAQEDAVGGWDGFVGGEVERQGELRATPPGFE